MGKRILIGCYRVPGYGGASTASYTLFKNMQKDGFHVGYVNLISRQDARHDRSIFGDSVGNPNGLPDVHTCVLQDPLFSPQGDLADLIKDVSPDIVISTGWKASLLMKRAAPETALVFMTSGCRRMKDVILEKDAKDFISLNESLKYAVRRLPLHNDLDKAKLEREAVAVADLIITNSDTVMSLYHHFFPSEMGKVYSDVIWVAEWTYRDTFDYAALGKPFDERDIDVLFVANKWSRIEKNYDLLKRIVSRCKGLMVHIVGEVEEQHANAHYHGLVARREDLFALMGRAKTIVSPSLFDAAPGILFEGSAMGCNLIASKNCGNWKICNSQLLVDPFDLAIFVEKISLSLSRKYEDNIGYFLGTNSQKKLIDAITTFKG